MSDLSIWDRIAAVGHGIGEAIAFDANSKSNFDATIALKATRVAISDLLDEQITDAELAAADITREQASSIAEAVFTGFLTLLVRNAQASSLN